MSAWIVSKKHIDYMVTAALALHERLAPFEGITGGKTPDELGRMLWRENLESVAYRYPQDKDGERPGPHGFRDSDVDTYVYEPTPLLEGGALAKTMGCYNYQSCEHPGYEQSEAKRLVGALYDTNVPFDNATPWGWE